MASKLKTIYVFEGPDRVGKSSLAKAFSEAINAPLFHFGKPDPALVEERGLQYQYEDLTNIFSDIVLDRSWVSGLFYEMFRRNQPASLDSVVSLENRLMHHGFNLQYIFVNRQWSKGIESDHLEEVEAGLGYGNMHIRKFEHVMWPMFVYKFLPLTAANLQVVHSPAPYNLKTSVSNLVNTHEHRQAVRQSYGKSSKRILRIFNSQTEVCPGALIWPSSKWPNNDPSRTF